MNVMPNEINVAAGSFESTAARFSTYLKIVQIPAKLIIAGFCPQTFRGQFTGNIK